MNFFDLLSSLLMDIVRLAEKTQAPPQLTDVLRVLAASIKESDDTIDDLKDVADKVKAMAAAGVDPSKQDFAELEIRIAEAQRRIQAAVQLRRTGY